MKRILLICSTALLATGCVSAGKVSEPKVQPPVAYEAPHPDPDSLSTAALQNWWSLYGDAQLDSLIADALANSHDTRDALAKLEQAAEIRAQNRAQILLPTGNPSANATHTQTDLLSGSSTIPGQPGGGFNQEGGSENYSANFNVSWELDLFGRRGAALRTVNADFYTAAFTYEATRTALAANVAQSLFQARGLALQLRDATEIARINRELVRVAKAKVDHGLSPGMDLDSATATAESAEASAESLRAQLQTARRTLLVLVGKGFDPLDSLPAEPVIGVLPAVPATLPGDLLRRRPDVRAAESRIVSAKGTLKVDELAQLPTIKINPGISLTRSTGAFGATSAAWSIGAGLTAPVLDRPRIIAQMRAQRAVAEQAVIAYEKSVQTAYGEVENAFVFLDSDRRRVEMLRTAERRSESAYDKARVSYSRGYSDLPAALQAETTWRNIRTQRSIAEATLMQRSVQVFKALGGGWTPETPAASTPYAGLAARAGEGVR